ncbi:MAG: LuxR family transcriptional regulator, partial [Spirochaetaceae bacterium]
VPSESLQGVALDELLQGGTQLCNLIDSRSAGAETSVSVVVELRNNGSSNGLLDIKASALRDSAGNRIGYVFVGRRGAGSRRSELIGAITPREVEIIEQILIGHTNAAIAEHLCISERTVKTHITHIFDKLGIENRIQLYGLLKDNHFISSHSADRHLIRIPGELRDERTSCP